jgi:hypothetical protein
MKHLIALLLVASTSVFANQTIQVAHQCYPTKDLATALAEKNFQLIFQATGYRNNELTHTAWLSETGESLVVGTLNDLSCILAEGTDTKFPYKSTLPKFY